MTTPTLTPTLSEAPMLDIAPAAADRFVGSGTPPGSRLPSLLTAVVVHGLLFGGFDLLLLLPAPSADQPLEIPVEVIAEPAPPAKTGTGTPGAKAGPAQGAPAAMSAATSMAASASAAPSEADREAHAATPSRPPEADPPKPAPPIKPPEPPPAADAGRAAAPAEDHPEPKPPALVAPPPETRAAAADTKPPPEPANVESRHRDPTPGATAPAPQAPPVLTTSHAGAEAVPVPAPSHDAASKPDPTKAPAPVDHRDEQAAKLAAALPMNYDALPVTFRAVLAGGGLADSEQYKGVVYGRLGRSQAAQDQARAEHLRGQVLVSFTVDDQGRVAALAVTHSSGNARLDGLAVQMIRDAAPFPPPPRGALRLFTPALSFGLE